MARARSGQKATCLVLNMTNSRFYLFDAVVHLSSKAKSMKRFGLFLELRGLETDKSAETMDKPTSQCC